eukprot:773681-Prorocentrum_lima.AAC.1
MSNNGIKLLPLCADKLIEVIYLYAQRVSVGVKHIDRCAWGRATYAPVVPRRGEPGRESGASLHKASPHT